jgi:hypothetical protein
MTISGRPDIDSLNRDSSIFSGMPDMGSLLGRRIYNNSGTLFALLIDSTRNSYIEATIISHTDSVISFSVHYSALNKRDSFKFEISYDLSRFKGRNFRRIDARSFQLNFPGSATDSSSTFNISRINNFVVQNGILEIMTGEITNPDNNRIKYVILNDPHDVFESLTGLCFLTIPNPALLRIQCDDRAKTVNCPSGLRPVSVVVPKNYFVARNYFCQVDCKY